MASNSSQINLPGITTVANHSNLGKAFEAELEAVHDYYRLQRLVDIVKNPSEWRFVGFEEYNKFYNRNPALVATTGDGRWMKRVKSDVDFSGGNSRHSFCFDAKETKANNFPLKNIEDHQIHRLKQSARCGTVAGAMIKLSALNRVFFVPVNFLDRKFEYWLKGKYARRAKSGTASISLSELEESGVEIFRHKSNSLWDWLPALEARNF